MAELARNATFSAGAVAWLQKPVSGESLEAVWNEVLGPIPEAPGLADLDELYPDRVQIEADEGPLLPALPGLPLPAPGLPLPELAVVAPTLEAIPAPKTKRKGRFLLILAVIVAAGLGVAYQQGMLPL